MKPGRTDVTRSLTQVWAPVFVPQFLFVMFGRSVAKKGDSDELQRLKRIREPRGEENGSGRVPVIPGRRW